MGKDGFARVWYMASMMMMLTGDSCRATKHLSSFEGKAAPSVQHRELQDSCGVCGTENFLEDDDAEMSCTTCNEVLIACMEDYGESETSSGGFGICHPCGDLSVDEVILFYEGICGDPLSSITQDYISGCLYYLVPPECPSDVTSSDDDYTTESSDNSSTDDDYTTESSDDYSTDDDYTIESSDDYSTSTTRMLRLSLALPPTTIRSRRPRPPKATVSGFVRAGASAHWRLPWSVLCSC
ncbi:unnamed protein product [Ectocarpus sp. 12 AP-2014]